MFKKAVLTSFLAASFLGGAPLIGEVKAQFDETLKEAYELEKQYRTATDPKEAASIGQYQTIVVINLFKITIDNGDENAFKEALKLASDFDLNGLMEVDGEYNFALEIVKQNRLNHLNELTKTNFNFKSAQLLQYAYKIGADRKIISRLMELEK